MEVPDITAERYRCTLCLMKEESSLLVELSGIRVDIIAFKGQKLVPRVEPLNSCHEKRQGREAK